MNPDLQEREQQPEEVPIYGRNPGEEHEKAVVDRSFPTQGSRGQKGADSISDDGQAIDIKRRSEGQRAEDELTDKKSGNPLSRITGAFGSFRLTRRRAGGGIIGLILALGIGGTFFVAPNFAIIHLKEILMDNFNYVRDAASDSQLKIFGKQLSENFTEDCGRVFKFRCRFQGLSNRQVEMLKSAGVEMGEVREFPKGCPFGRQLCRIKPKTLIIGDEELKAKEVVSRLRNGDRELISKLRTGFRPRYVAFASKAFDKVRAQRNLSKEPVTGNTQEEIQDELDELIEEAAEGGDDGKITQGEDGKYYDDDGNEVSEEQAKGYDNLKKTNDDLQKVSLSGTALSGAANVGYGALNVTKAAAIPCEAYGYLKITAIGLKVIAASTFVAVAWNAIFQPADTLKLGEGAIVATVLMAGSRLFTPDAAGNTAFETPQYESTVNRVPRRGYNDKEKRLYGALSLGMAGSVVNNALSAIKRYTGNSPDSSCKVVENPWVQGGGLVVGIALAIFTGGASALASAGITASAQVAIGVAMAAVIPTIMDIVSNKLGKNAFGGKLFNMANLGKARLHSDNAQATSMRPQSKQAAAEQTKRTLAADRERAEDERLVYKPWDIGSPYTLAGSTIRGLSTKVATVRSGIALAALPGKLFGSIASGLNVKASAATSEAEYAQWRANECKEDFDPNVATGPDCEVEYKTSLQFDPEENAAWLEDNGFIDSEGNPTEKAKGDAGGNYYRDCVERTAPIGLTDDNTKDTGGKCVDGQGGDKEELFDRFAELGVANVVMSGMDEEPNPSLGSGEEGAAGPVVGGTSAAEVAAFKKRVDEEWGNGKVPENALCPVGTESGFKGHRLFCGAQQMFTQVNAVYKQRFRRDICITDSYRTYEEQVRLKAEKPSLAATPGTSNHGYGTAMDLCGGIQNFGTPEHNWLRDNGPRYGWFHPSWAQAGGKKPEPWHFEFQGIGGSGQ